MKLIANLADVCLPDYWTGHHLAHVGVPVDNRTTMVEFKNLAKNEIILGAIAGSVESELTDSQEWADAALVAIENLETKTPDYSGPLFPDLEETAEDYCESVYAYIVFSEYEG